jgi:hypothetical protein
MNIGWAVGVMLPARLVLAALALLAVSPHPHDEIVVIGAPAFDASAAGDGKQRATDGATESK